MIKLLDITKTFQGAYKVILIDEHKDSLQTFIHQYMGYTKKEAITKAKEDFRQELNNNIFNITERII